MTSLQFCTGRNLWPRNGRSYPLLAVPTQQVGSTVSTQWSWNCMLGAPKLTGLQRMEQLAKRLFDHRPELDKRGISSRVRFGIELVKMLLDVLTDILVYMANQCSRESHAKQLSRGGEFTIHVWLMAEYYHEASYHG
ncbi:unnamed protein product [Urochloa humidicola]